MEEYDAVVVGSGPNGLAAAIRLVTEGHGTLLIEARERLGGGLLTDELTLPGFRHDRCAAIHTMGVLSPFFKKLPLHEHGLEWAFPEASVAHPLDDGDAVLLEHSLEETANALGRDGARYRKLLAPLLEQPDALFEDLLAPLGVPSSPLLLMRFGFYALRPATLLARAFETREARALLAGCAAHSILPLSSWGTAAFGLVFLLSGHIERWPAVRGGSERLAEALAGHYRKLGGEVLTGRRIDRLSDLPPSKVVLFDLSPRDLARIAADELPAGYKRRLGRYVYGPGLYKLDWALSQAIPWKDPRVARASTVHVGGTIEEISAAEAAVWRDEHPERPFVLLCQQSHFDDTRAPAGKHTGYAYCHVPAGSTVDMSARVEAQIERFAPGFKDTILARHVTTPSDLERYNPCCVGGAATGGAAFLSQLFTRPVARIDPYATPNPRLFLCSQSTPPGGGVHGMCGYHAANSAIRRLRRTSSSLGGRPQRSALPPLVEREPPAS